MNEYNERWTREMFIEYRKLKRSGYSHQMLKEHYQKIISFYKFFEPLPACGVVIFNKITKPQN